MLLINNKLIEQDDNKTIKTYWMTLSDILAPKGERTQELPGFDDEFIDIVDYIIRITHRIWEQKDVGLCERYYSDYCPVYSLGGYIDSYHTVIKNTLKTIAAFPDRSLIGENVVWRDMGEQGYYSSHRITSIMTNKRTSEFGPATGETGRVTTIADCICHENKIIYEWLMRDNSFLIEQLGMDFVEVANHMAKTPVPKEFTDWKSQQIERVRKQLPHEDYRHQDDDSWHVNFAQNWLDTFLNKKSFSQLKKFYSLTAKCQWPGGRECTGIPGISGNLIQWFAQCPDAQATCDHVAVVPFDEPGVLDIAIRWSLVGTYHPDLTSLSHLAGKDYFILAGTHLRIKNEKIINEWTVFDEVSAITNLIREYQVSD